MGSVVEAWLAFHMTATTLWKTTGVVMSLSLHLDLWREAHTVLGSYGMCCAVDGKLLRSALKRISALRPADTPKGKVGVAVVIVHS